MRQLKVSCDLDGVILFWIFFLKKHARLVLDLLISHGHQIKVVTARGNFLTLLLAKLTLKFHGLGNLKVVGVGRNGKKYKELDEFDMFIDNKVEQLIAIDGKVKHLYIFDKNPKTNFQNLENWWDIYWEVDRVSNES